MAHLALAVRDLNRSRRFYETYFGFDAARVADDGVLLLENGAGFVLALGETLEPIELPSFLHFAFAPAVDPADVRAFRDRVEKDGVPIVAVSDEPDYVSVKCRDPDGYVVEFAWESDD